MQLSTILISVLASATFINAAPVNPNLNPENSDIVARADVSKIDTRSNIEALTAAKSALVSRSPTERRPIGHHHAVPSAERAKGKGKVPKQPEPQS
ncbi:hypothetical protein TWF718_002985 [Orbilia javanica]|uniref:Uncharacterized protein n=1 Tax=Orbilia javanica TaxID=47235 RepID=A0AAN8RJ97_9PEZI